MDNNFKDKTVIITGGSEGVGAATARKFAAAGANLVLAARGKRKLEKIGEELRPITKVVLVAMDVADSDACSNLLRKAAFEFDNIDVLVNNAGYHERGFVENVSPEALGMMLDVNLKAPIILSKLVIPYLRETGGGAIINVASLAGRTPVPGAATYSASKFGLRAFTFSLADELGDANIKLAAVSPGPIDTGFIMSNIDDVTDLTFSQPMSTADEVATEIVRLCVNSKRERSMPPISGFLSTLNYLFPFVGDLLRPALTAKGRRVKRQLKAKFRAAAREAERDSDRKSAQ
jgi:short-subunit dehydrogenase